MQTLHTVLRSIGGALQILGVASIYFEIRHARASLGVAPQRNVRATLRRVGNRIQRALGVKKSATVSAPLILAGISSMSTVEARRTKSLTGKSFQAQIDILAERIEESRKEVLEKLNLEAERRATGDGKEALDRKQATDGLQEALQDSTLGGFRIKGYSAVLIIAGIALTTWG